MLSRYDTVSVGYVSRKPMFHLNGWTDRAVLAQKLPLAYLTLCFKGIRAPSIIMVLHWNQHASIVAGVLNLVRPTTVASLSHWASTFVYNNMSAVRLRQLRLVLYSSLYAVGRLSACLSSVTLVHPILSRLKFSAMFLDHLVPGHPLTFTENFTEIVPGEPLAPSEG